MSPRLRRKPLPILEDSISPPRFRSLRRFRWRPFRARGAIYVTSRRGNQSARFRLPPYLLSPPNSCVRLSNARQNANITVQSASLGPYDNDDNGYLSSTLSRVEDYHHIGLLPRVHYSRGVVNPAYATDNTELSCGEGNFHLQQSASVHNTAHVFGVSPCSAVVSDRIATSYSGQLPSTPLSPPASELARLNIWSRQNAACSDPPSTRTGGHRRTTNDPSLTTCPPDGNGGATQTTSQAPALPDIVPPPAYATLPGGTRVPRVAAPPPPLMHNVRRMRAPRFLPEHTEEPKHYCCGLFMRSATRTSSIRWFIVIIAIVGMCCSIVGTVLGAMRVNGREHLTVSLLMIGVGIVLITVSGVAWRLTSYSNHSSVWGLHGFHEPNRRFVPRVPPYGRHSHPYAAMLYPDFPYRPPPPSYQASMQEYRLRLLLLDRHNDRGDHAPSMSPISPPPTYRSHTTSRPPLLNLAGAEYPSRPPSYHSRTSSGGGVLRACLGGETRRNSQDTLNSQRLSTPPDTPTCDITPTSTNRSTRYKDMTIVAANQRSSIALEPLPLAFRGTSGVSRSNTITKKNHDVNAVTIVQTTDTSQVVNQDTVIVSVSGGPRTIVAPSTALGTNVVIGTGNGGKSHEVHILAHV